MLYKVEDIEDQLIATLKADSDLSAVRCTVATHAGEVNPRMFLDASLLEGFITQLPFIFIQYQGKRVTERSATARVYVHNLRFRFYVGCQSLRAKKEGQRSAYAMLRSVYDDVHGKIPYASATSGSPLPKLTGVEITSASFNGSFPFVEGASEDEKLIVNLPSIVVYQTDYMLNMVT